MTVIRAIMAVDAEMADPLSFLLALILPFDLGFSVSLISGSDSAGGETRLLASLFLSLSRLLFPGLPGRGLRVREVDSVSCTLFSP